MSEKLSVQSTALAARAISPNQGAHHLPSAASAALASYGTTRTENDTVYLDYTVPISDTQRITASLQVLWPEATGDGFYRITRWQTESTGEWQPQDGLPVYGSGSSAVGALPGKP